jgi:hypothetical protein
MRNSHGVVHQSRRDMTPGGLFLCIPFARRALLSTQSRFQNSCSILGTGPEFIPDLQVRLFKLVVGRFCTSSALRCSESGSSEASSLYGQVRSFRPGPCWTRNSRCLSQMARRVQYRLRHQLENDRERRRARQASIHPARVEQPAYRSSCSGRIASACVEGGPS